jgi:Ni/Co efflux regulator RcnB
MKKLLFMLIIAGFATSEATAQQTGSAVTNQPATYIPSAENASYQNNSMFYNKDNTIDMNSTQMTGNAYYTTPGFSNPINSSPNGRVQSNNERQQNITIMGFEDYNLTKLTYYNQIPKTNNQPSK